MRAYIGIFETSGRMAQPWANAGYPCIVLDSQNNNTERDGVFYARCELSHEGQALMLIKNFTKITPIFVAAFPPCDHMAVSGSRWMQGKGLRALQSSIGLIATAAAICELLDAPYFIEQPVSTLSTYWRKPDYHFNPYDYSGFCADDTYTKKTCLWAGNGFRMPPPCPLDVVPDDRIHKAPPGPDRKNFRSATPLGFARAVFEEHDAR